MNKLNNMRIIVVAVCVIAFLALLCRSDNRIAPIIAEQSNSTIGAEVDNLSTSEQTRPTTDVSSNLPFKLSDIPSYSGTPYCEVNNNQPFFHADKLTTESFKRFSELDSLGRCGVAYACIGTDSLPTEERGEIGMIKPSGWHTVRYDDLIEDKYLYNRCHLIAFELSGENANPQNLITGTRYMNIEGMLPFENRVHDYVENSNNHVMYRVTPVFEGDNLVANGVLMEGYSVEDNGTGICFNAFCYNVQPYIEIDYADGTSWISDQSDKQLETETQNILSDISNDFEIWKTTYCHRMPSFDSIIEWYKGTGLRPYLEQLTESDVDDFVNDVYVELKKRYKMQKNSEILFRFPRLFFIARKA